MLCDYVNSADCFPQIDIAGGVNYYLWSNSHTGLCEIVSIRGGKRLIMHRKLNEFDIFVRNNASVGIINNVLNSDDGKMDQYVFSRNVFGITSSEHGTEKRENNDDLILYSSQKGNSLGSSYISKSKVQKNHTLINEVRKDNSMNRSYNSLFKNTFYLCNYCRIKQLSYQLIISKEASH